MRNSRSLVGGELAVNSESQAPGTWAADRRGFKCHIFHFQALLPFQAGSLTLLWKIGIIYTHTAPPP